MQDEEDIPSEREQRVNEVLGAYLELAEAGCAPPREDLLDCYPDIADELRDRLADHDRIAAIASPQPEVDETEPVGDYEQLTKLKSGGMGTVFKAWHRGRMKWGA